jgi:hypothetical protein
MKSMPRYTASGPFVTRDMGDGVWQLTAGAPAGSEIYLRIAGSDASRLLKDAEIATLNLDWYGDGVTVTLTATKGSSNLEAKTAIIHQPKGPLYETLPLASFDAGAKRFWKRVFLLMRIPGGRLLLGAIARRGR